MFNYVKYEYRESRAQAEPFALLTSIDQNSLLNLTFTKRMELQYVRNFLRCYPVRITVPFEEGNRSPQLKI